MNLPPIRIGIIAGELSGDLLGANLIHALRRLHPNIIIEAIAGPRMIAAGATAIFPMEKIAGAGFFELLGRLPEILKTRRRIKHYFLSNRPDVVIGIDAPEFNLSLEKQLRRAGIPTIHYVSPSVWAWRSWRWRKIAKAVDLLLTLFSFETDFYQKHQIPVRYVGHPLADAIPLQTDQAAARHFLNLPEKKTTIALLPGSRASELKQHSALFIRTAVWCLQRQPSFHFVVALATPAAREIFTRVLRKIAPTLPISLIDGNAQQVMGAADSVLLASGTATLECALVKRPMVVAYRLFPLTYWLGIWLIKVKHFALPNLLTGKELVPEFIQQRATVQNLGPALLESLTDQKRRAYLQQEFLQLHQNLSANHGMNAARAVLELVEKKGKHGSHRRH